MTIPIVQETLDNGLQILLKEMHTVPLISHWVWYRVGSRDEQQGRRGISHWVEHMLFKGSPNFPSSNLDRVISREGGLWNALTHLDWTTFYETMPADKIDIALQLEADRMQNCSFDPGEVESERTVILSEMEGKLNEPSERLMDAIQQASFDQHSYRYEVIGEEQDLRTMTRNDLFEHYRGYYHPHNAIVAIAGDFDSQQMLDRLRELYSNIPSGPTPPRPSVTEEPLCTERRVEIKGPGSTTYLGVAYRSPAASHPDFFPFVVMDSLLSGPMSLNMFGGGGTSNKTTRLYRNLVEKELAVSVNGGMHATIDPFLYQVFAIVHPNQQPDTVLRGMDDQFKRLQDQLIHSDEIARAIKQSRALFAYGGENITNQAFWLGYAEMFAKYEWFLNYLERLEAVTPEDVQRIAQNYLRSDGRVVGLYIPTGEELEEEEE